MSTTDQTVAVGSSQGLHARPAKLFVQAAKASGIPVCVSRPGEKPVDAASLLSVISLGVGCGDQVTLSAEGEGSAEVIRGLAELLEKNHDE